MLDELPALEGSDNDDSPWLIVFSVRIESRFSTNTQCELIRHQKRGVEMGGTYSSEEIQAQADGQKNVQIVAKPSALVVCGPSGVGKGTLIKKLMDGSPRLFGFSCSHTTRAPRQGEEVSKAADPHSSVARFSAGTHVHGGIVVMH